MTSDIKTIQDLFGILNTNCKYVVLRNWDDIFDANIYGSGHEDIDILCESINDFIQLTDAYRIHGDEFRDNLCVRLDNKIIRFDVRHIGDNYYPAEWEKAILENREQLHNGIFIMNDENYAYSLAYHALCQKPSLSPEYYNKISDAYKKAERIDASIKIEPSDLISLLKKYCDIHGYNVKTPEDPGVFLNWHNLKILNATDSIQKKVRRLKLRINQRFSRIQRKMKI